MPLGGQDLPMSSGRGGIGGTGFQPVWPYREDAGATKNFSRQFLMGLCPTRKT
jgi:hypothetical protein